MFADLPLDLVDHLSQHHLGVADGPEADPVVLVEVLGAVGALGQRHAVGHGGVEVGHGKAGAKPQYEVGLLQELGGHQRARGGAGAESKPVALGEGAFARQGGHNRHASQLGKLDQLIRGLRVEHTLARVDHRVGRLQHRRHQVAHVVRVAARPELAHRRVVEGVVGYLLGDHVPGQLQHHRTAPPVFELAEGHPHHLRYTAGQVDVAHPLGDLAVVPVGLEVGMNVHAVPRLPTRKHQDWYGVCVGLGHASEGVLGARPGLHAEDAYGPAVLDTAEAVGHIHPGPLLPGEDRPDALPGGCVDQGLAGKQASHSTPSALSIFAMSVSPFICFLRAILH